MSEKFLIVGAPRTGSTLLVKTLNSLDAVRCHGELLGPGSVRGLEDGFDLVEATKEAREARASRLIDERKQGPVQFISNALSSDCAATGFKALYQTILLPQWEEVCSMLVAMPDLKIIHLQRHNSLRRFISEQVLQGGGAIHSEAGGRSEAQIKVPINVDAFIARDAELQAQRDEFFSQLSGQTILDISYEALAEDTAAAVQTVCEFLGLSIEKSAIAPALKKVGAVDLRESVSNYQALLQHEATAKMVLSD